MSVEGQKFIPGDAASPLQLVALADEYRRAAETLRSTSRPRVPLSQAPFRQNAMHAIELYLNAVLVQRGIRAAELRAMHHDVAKRAELTQEAGLRLRKKTEQHLRSMFERREYQAARYGPEWDGPGSPLTRIETTLTEIARKVAALIGKDAT